MQGTGEKAWLAQGKITCPDVAAMWGSKIGDAEFRLLDHPNWPSSSADFPSKKEAMTWAINGNKGNRPHFHRYRGGIAMQSYNYIVTINYRTPKGRSSYYTWEGPALGPNDATWWANIFLFSPIASASSIAYAYQGEDS
jgi:hypothetical protein